MRIVRNKFLLGASALSFVMAVSVYPGAQSPTEPPPPFASATSLASNSPTGSLTLPGSLTLTSIVSAPNGGGVPTGTVTFGYDTSSNNLGSANLAILPNTEAFPSTPSNLFSFGTEPFPFWAASVFSASNTDLAIVDQNGCANPYQGAILTIYPGLGKGAFNTSSQFNTLPTDTCIDALASGDFHHNGKQEFLLHVRPYSLGPGQYHIVDATLADTPIPIPQCNNQNCNINDPDNETVVVDDFTGDGFPDIASLVSNYSNLLQSYIGSHTSDTQVIQPQIRIAVNSGGTNVSFAFSPNAMLPPIVGATTDSYCPLAIASGQFRTSGNKDLISVGQHGTVCSKPSPEGYLVLFLGDGKGDLAFQTPVPLGHSPVAVGVGDFNKDGKLDAVVANSDNTVEILYGNGDGTFAAQIFSITAGNVPTSLRVADFNGDGYPDVAIGDSSGNVYVLMNDGTGKLLAPIQVLTGPAETVSILTQDMNGDGLADLTTLSSPPPPGASQGAGPIGLAVATSSENVNVLLNSASAQAVLNTAAQSLPMGSHTLTAAYAGDLNFNSSTSSGIPISVQQTTPVITWPPPAPITYGTPLSTTQLNATASVPGSFIYTPAAGTILTPGISKLSLTFTPTDIFDYTAATSTVALTVTGGASLTSISPTTTNVGSPAFSLSVVGQGFIKGATVQWNGMALATTFVDFNHLTAQVPASLLTTPGTATVTAIEPGIPVNGSPTLTIALPSAVATATGPQSSAPGTQPSVQVTLNPYPVDVTVTLTLGFTPAPPNQATDPAVLFGNGTLVETFVVPANSTVAIPPVSLQTGSTAGTITVTPKLAGGGANITPSTLAPVVIVVPAQAPVISSVTLTRNGQSLQLVIDGLSSPRDMSQADFHITALPGVDLTTPDLTVPLNGAFTTWYQNTASTPFGTNFQYTQPFTLSDPATVIQSVTVTLTNSVGKSQAANAQ